MFEPMTRERLETIFETFKRFETFEKYAKKITS